MNLQQINSQALGMSTLFSNCFCVDLMHEDAKDSIWNLRKEEAEIYKKKFCGCEDLNL